MNTNAIDYSTGMNRTRTFTLPPVDELDEYRGTHTTYSYHGYFTPSTLRYFGTGDASDPGYSLTYGVENETTDYTGSYNRPMVAAILHKEFGSFVHCERDGSIGDGNEIISQPATLAYHMRKARWADVLGTVDDAGGKAHDAHGGCCGLHVHIGRAGLGMTDKARDLCIAKLVILTDRFYEHELTVFARRTYEQISQWAGKNSAGIVPGDHQCDVIAKSKHGSGNRYRAVNLTNANTVEIRVFRATTNLETFAATLQLVDAMVRYCKTHTTDQVLTVSFADIVDTCKYPECKAYCIRRGIAVNA